MPAKFQSLNSTTGTLQFDGVFTNYVLERVVTLLTDTAIVQGSSSATQGSTAIAAGEIIALRSDVPSALVSVQAGRAYVRARGPIGKAVTCYVFGPISTSTARAGFQLFHEVTGELLFCASKKLLRFAGVVADHGDFVYDAGRTYAAIMLNQYYTGISRGFAQGGTVTVTTEASRSMITAIPGGINVALTQELLWVRFMGNAEWGSYPKGASTDLASTARHAIIDVTGYA